MVACHSGNRSARAAQALRDAGWTTEGRGQVRMWCDK
ncbi:MAG: hypothetical protein ACLPKT_16605 [Methylocella sp.]